VKGEITALESLEIHASARVHGNLVTPSLMIEKGAVFEGGCSMESSGRGARKDTLVVAMKDRKNERKSEGAS
jgi:cytoskeletal protein CcmA (bactofilin family)